MPMDLTTVKNKLNSGQYQNSLQVKADINLIWYNCKKFNLEDSVRWAFNILK